MPKPRIVILAGPNGAGKTTAAKYLLTEAFGILEFVNADTIAAGLSAYAPETVAFEAGRVMLSRIESLLASKKSFAFETTLASKSVAKFIPRARKAGHRVSLIMWRYRLSRSQCDGWQNGLKTAAMIFLSKSLRDALPVRYKISLHGIVHLLMNGSCTIIQNLNRQR